MKNPKKVGEILADQLNDIKGFKFPIKSIDDYKIPPKLKRQRELIIKAHNLLKFRKKYTREYMDTVINMLYNNKKGYTAKRNFLNYNNITTYLLEKNKKEKIKEQEILKERLIEKLNDEKNMLCERQRLTPNKKSITEHILKNSNDNIELSEKGLNSERNLYFNISKQLLSKEKSRETLHTNKLSSPFKLKLGKTASNFYKVSQINHSLHFEDNLDPSILEDFNKKVNYYINNVNNESSQNKKKKVPKLFSRFSIYKKELNDSLIYQLSKVNDNTRIKNLLIFSESYENGHRQLLHEQEMRRVNNLSFRKNKFNVNKILNLRKFLTNEKIDNNSLRNNLVELKGNISNKQHLRQNKSFNKKIPIIIK